MNKTTKNEKGFSAVETIMALVILILIIGLGYLVYKNDHKTAPKTVIVKSQTTNSTKSNSPPNNYFVFKELGVEFLPDKSLTGLNYTPTSPVSGSLGGAYITDSNVVAAYNQCQANAGSNTMSSDTTGENTSFAAITKLPGVYSSASNSDGVGQLVKQFNGFYISISYPNGSTCASSSQTDQNNWSLVSKSAAKVFAQSLTSTIKEN